MNEENDPYLWLEEVEGQKALAWVDEMSQKTKETFYADPYAKEVEDFSLNVLENPDQINIPHLWMGQVYQFWKDDVHIKGVLRRTAFESFINKNEDWEMVLDLDDLAKKENEDWVWKYADVNQDSGRALLYFSRGGKDAVVIREFDLFKKEFVQNGFFFPESKGWGCWLDQDQVAMVTDQGEGSFTDSGYPRVLKIFKREESSKEGREIYRMNPEHVYLTPFLFEHEDQSRLILFEHISFYNLRYYSLEKENLVRLYLPEKSRLYGLFSGQLVIKIDEDFEGFIKGSLLSIDYQEALKKEGQTYQVLYCPSQRSSIDGVFISKSSIIIHLLENVVSKILFIDKDWKTHEPRFDCASLALYEFSSKNDWGFIVGQDYLTPQKLEFIQGFDQKRILIQSQKSYFDQNQFIQKQYWVKNSDGVEIPYTIVHHKDIELNGKNPTLLYGYGGFMISLAPVYSATRGKYWLEQGGVYCVANIRGGGEFGPGWHQAALRENRQKAYDDFIVVALDLIDRKITTPRHLGIWGGSNGGLLVGAVFVQRPDLFNAVTCAVPLLDMKRYHKLLAGASWMAEYGDPDIEKDWAYLQKFSPYHNLSSDKKYPEILFYTSTKDDRVHPGHARKMAYKMLEMGKKVHYFENRVGGHAAASDFKQRAMLDGLVLSYFKKYLF